MADDKKNVAKDVKTRLIDAELELKTQLVSLDEPVSNFHGNLPGNYDDLFFSFGQFKAATKNLSKGGILWQNLLKTGLKGIADSVKLTTADASLKIAHSSFLKARLIIDFCFNRPPSIISSTHKARISKIYFFLVNLLENQVAIAGI